MGKAAELQREIEAHIREYFADLKDEHFQTVTRGVYFGNSLFQFFGVTHWKSGLNSTSPVACQQSLSFNTNFGATVQVQQLPPCPNNVSKFKITVS